MSCRRSCFSRKTLKDMLDRKRKELDELLAQQSAMLGVGNVQSYTIGKRSLSRYNFSLKDIRDAIDQLEKDILKLEAQLRGCSTHRTQGVIPRDW